MANQFEWWGGSNHSTEIKEEIEKQLNDLSLNVDGFAKKEDVPEKTSDLTNDSGFQTANEVDAAIDAKLSGYQAAITIDDEIDSGSENPVQNKVIKDALDEKADKSEIPSVPSDVSAFTNDAGYQTSTEVDAAIDAKLNGYQTSITIDDELDENSENPVQNKVIKEAIDALMKVAGETDYPITWDATTKELVLNEGEVVDGISIEQRLQLTGLAGSSDIPDVSGFAKSSDLSAVATSGDYDDLTNKPTIPAAYDDTDLKDDISSINSSISSINSDVADLQNSLAELQDGLDVELDYEHIEITADEVAALFKQGGS